MLCALFSALCTLLHKQCIVVYSVVYTVYTMLCMLCTIFVHWVPPPPVLRPAPRKIRRSFVRQPIQLHHPFIFVCLFLEVAGMTKCPHPPRLVELTKWANFPGYGFNLHAEKARQGEISAGYKVYKCKYTRTNTNAQIRTHKYKNQYGFSLHTEKTRQSFP